MGPFNPSFRALCVNWFSQHFLLLLYFYQIKLIERTGPFKIMLIYSWQRSLPSPSSQKYQHISFFPPLLHINTPELSEGNTYRLRRFVFRRFSSTQSSYQEEDVDLLHFLMHSHKDLSLFWPRLDCVIGLWPSSAVIISLYYKLQKTRLDLANIFCKSECPKYFYSLG